ncbi:MAG: glycosyltransferase family 9 protein [Ignavibacteria bacterium]
MKDNINILVVQIGKIGDMILTTPLFGSLKRIFPDCCLSVLASKSNSVITKNLNCIDRTYVYDKKTISTASLLIKLRKKAFDYWIDPKDELSSTSKILVNLCKPKLSIGFNFNKKVFDIDLRTFVKGEHRVDINLSPVNYLSDSDRLKTPIPHVDIPEKDSKIISERLNVVTAPFVLLNLSSGVSSRYLKLEKWIDLVDGINPDKYVILTGINKDYDNIHAVISSVKRKNVFFVEANTIFEFAELIRKCNLLVTPDTSAVHLASCFNAPVVGIYHNVKWNIVKFGPLSVKKRIVVSAHENSLDSIESKELIEAVNELLP